MKRHSAPVPPKHLGVIGREHLKARFLAAGGAEETFKYERQTGVSQDIPYVIECAFGLHQSGLDGRSAREAPDRHRRQLVGRNPKSISKVRKDRRRPGKQARLRCGRTPTQPVIFALHLASAHIQYADRGKSSIIVDGDVEAADV